MSHRHFVSALVFTFSVFFVVSCKKKDDKTVEPPQSPQPSRTDLITAKLWKISGLTSGSSDLWNSGLVDPCNKDNTYRFKVNNILTAYDLPTKCNGSDPDSTNNPWTFTDNDTRIYVKINLNTTVEDTASIIELTESKIVLDADYNSVPVRFTLTPD
jgi:hypothetical protein